MWGTPTTLPEPTGDDAQLNSVSCVSAGNCVAVGGLNDASGDWFGLIAVETGGTWDAPVTLSSSELPSNAETATGKEDVQLRSVSCYSATNCTAVGTYADNAEDTASLELPITLSGAVATPSPAEEVNGVSDTDAPALSSVSCSSSGSCIATGTDVDGQYTEPIVATSDGRWRNDAQISVSGVPSSWGFVGNLSGGQAPYFPVSCPASGACTAVINFNDPQGNSHAFLLPLADGTPGTAVALAAPEGSSTNNAAAISCPSAATCTVTGVAITSSATEVAFATPVVNGTPAAPVVLASPAPIAAGDLIACSDALDCDLGGVMFDSGANTTLLATDNESAGTWGPLTSLSGIEGAANGAYLTGLGCSAASTCALIGLIEPAAGGVESFGVTSAPKLSVSTGSLPAATVGSAYSATLQAAGGIGASAWSITGALPAGLSLNAATGVISGTPTSAGNDTFVADASNGVAPAPVQSADGAVSIAVASAPTTAPATPTPPVSTPVTTPPPTLKPAVAVVKVTKVSDKGAKVSITLSCAKAVCKGTLGLSVVEHLTGTKVTSLTAIAKAKKTRTLTLAKGTYTLAAGKTRTLTLTLTKTAAKLLTARHRFTAKLALTPAGSKRATVTKTVTLKAAVVKQPRPKRPKRV